MGVHAPAGKLQTIVQFRLVFVKTVQLMVGENELGNRLSHKELLEPGLRGPLSGMPSAGSLCDRRFLFGVV